MLRKYSDSASLRLQFLILFIASLSVFAVTGNFSFLATWDDNTYVVLNDTVKGFTASHVKEAFTGNYIGNYAPLHILSYMADHALWGMNAAGYHIENVIIHSVNGLLFFLILIRMSFERWVSFAASWVFVLHPVQVETVAWISQRKNLLAMLFFLAAFLAYQSFLTANKGHRVYYLLSLCSFAASLLSKSIAVVFPVILLIYENLHPPTCPRKFTERMKSVAPFFILAAIFGIAALVSQEQGGGRTGYPGGSPAAAFFTMVPVLVGYIKNCLWPSGLSPFYITEIRLRPDSAFLLALLIILALAGVGEWLRRHNRPLFFWYAVFFISLLPVMQIIPLVTLKQDRYLYFPLLGFSVVAASFASRLLQHIAKRAWVVNSVFIVILVLLSVSTYRQTLHWRDDVTLWQRATNVDGKNRLGWRLLAMAYTAKGDAGNAAQALQRFAELEQKYGPLHGHDAQW